MYACIGDVWNFSGSMLYWTHEKVFKKYRVSVQLKKKKQDFYIRIADLKQAIEHDKK